MLALCNADGKPVEVQLRLIEDVAAAVGVVNTAKDEGVDLIVAGSHGRTGIGKLMLGSVAAKLVALSPVPVLVSR